MRRPKLLAIFITCLFTCTLVQYCISCRDCPVGVRRLRVTPPTPALFHTLRVLQVLQIWIAVSVCELFTTFWAYVVYHRRKIHTPVYVLLCYFFCKWVFIWQVNRANLSLVLACFDFFAQLCLNYLAFPPCQACSLLSTDGIKVWRKINHDNSEKIGFFDCCMLT